MLFDWFLHMIYWRIEAWISYKTKIFHVVMGLYSNGSQSISKCIKNITDTQGCVSWANFCSYINWSLNRCRATLTKLTLYLPDQICNSPFCQSYNSHSVSSENLVLDQLIISKLIFFFILSTYLVDIVLIL